MTVPSIRAAKAVLFWVSIIFLGVMLWRITAANKSQPRQDQITYNEFMTKVDSGEVAEVTIYSAASSYDVVGQYLRPMGHRFHLTIFKEAAPDILTALREKGVLVDMKPTRSSDWTLILLNGAPLILLAAFCFFLMATLRSRTWRSVGARWPAAHVGFGYDLHRLEAGRKLIVGGIELPFDKGSVGHSDGDVLAHALCDALLGAAGLGDIGTHFPDTDPQWKGANSLRFLEHAKKLLGEKSFAIEHVDAVVITEKPKLGPHFAKMREALAQALGVAPEKIHLKAKTNEGVDAVGRGEAIAAHVVATLAKH
jgi:2-C-methyl-D-erythritol 2,4-cyclodiphosphate synthase